MAFLIDKPVPSIDLSKCDGCGLCVHACPTKAMDMLAGKAVVSNPQACEYSGQCEGVCPTQAISRPFEIVITCDDEEFKSSNSTKVVENN